MDYKSLVLMLSCCVMAMSCAAITPHCSELEGVITGVNVYRRLMASLYNTKIALEDPDGDYGIATGLFENFQVMGAFGVYSRALAALSKESVGLDYSGMFGAMMTQVMRNACIWLNSYGDSLTLRSIDCNDEEELTLLSAFLYTYPQVDTLKLYLFNHFGCSGGTIEGEEQWLNNYINGSYANELSTLANLVGK